MKMANADENLANALNQIPSLFCPVCVHKVKEPKLLSCAHTFCKSCIEQLPIENDIARCPICRNESIIKNGDASNLHTNFVLKSILDELDQMDGSCDQCVDKNTMNRLAFCNDCDKYLCEKCRNQHDAKDEYKSHKFSRKRTFIKDHSYCSEHPNEICNVVCIYCSKQLCRQCKVTHDKRKHETRHNITYSYEVNVRAEFLRERIRVVSENFRKITDHCLSQQRESENHIDEMIEKIKLAHSSAEIRLKEGQQTLIDSCEYLRRSVDNLTKAELEKINQCSPLLEQARTLTELVFNKPAEELPEHDSIIQKVSQNFAIILNGQEERSKRCNKLNRLVGKLRFEVGDLKTPTHLGDLQIVEWSKSVEVNLDEGRMMTCMAIAPDGGVAIGFFQGGADFCKIDGTQKSLVKTESILALAFFKDGCFVLRTADNDIFIHDINDKRGKKMLDQISYDQGGYGDLTIDSDDNIYTSYEKLHSIYIYSRKSRKAINKIECGNGSLQQMAAMPNGKLVIMNGDRVEIKNLDSKENLSVTRSGFFGYPTVAHDGSILIAWINQDAKRVSVIQYNQELTLLKTLFSTQNFDLTGRSWYRVLEVRPGLIAFCAQKKFYLMKRSKKTFEKETFTIE